MNNSAANFFMQIKKEARKELTTRFYLACGYEDMFYQMNLDAKKIMNKLNLNLTSQFTKGNHNWNYWNLQLQDAINWSLQK